MPAGHLADLSDFDRGLMVGYQAAKLGVGLDNPRGIGVPCPDCQKPWPCGSHVCPTDPSRMFAGHNRGVELDRAKEMLNNADRYELYVRSYEQVEVTGVEVHWVDGSDEVATGALYELRHQVTLSIAGQKFDFYNEEADALLQCGRNVIIENDLLDRS